MYLQWLLTLLLLVSRFRESFIKLWDANSIPLKSHPSIAVCLLHTSNLATKILLCLREYVALKIKHRERGKGNKVRQYMTLLVCIIKGRQSSFVLRTTLLNHQRVHLVEPYDLMSLYLRINFGWVRFLCFSPALKSVPLPINYSGWTAHTWSIIAVISGFLLYTFPLSF